VSYDGRMTGRAIAGRALMAVGCLLAGDCGGPQFQPLNRTTLRASQPHSIVAAKTSLRELTLDPQARGRGVIAAVLAQNRADEAAARLRRGRPLTDPALTIRERLLAGMARRFSLQIVNSGTSETSATSPRELAAHYPGVDLILDVHTSDWGIRAVGNGNYGPAYDGEVTLVDGRSGELLARGFCSSHPVSLSAGPSLDKLVADDAALLHDTIAAITDECVDDYRKRLLGLY
jgi:hypothetical protein